MKTRNFSTWWSRCKSNGSRTAQRASASSHERGSSRAVFLTNQTSDSSPSLLTLDSHQGMISINPDSLPAPPKPVLLSRVSYFIYCLTAFGRMKMRYRHRTRECRQALQRLLAPRPIRAIPSLSFRASISTCPRLFQRFSTL